MSPRDLYQDRKLAGLCTRCGKAPAAEGANECAEHLAERRAAAAPAQRKRRRSRRRQGLCAECPRKSGKKFYCTVCATKYAARRANMTVSKTVSNGHSDRIASRTSKDAGNRTRYHGQDRRGAITRAQLDKQTLQWAMAELIKCEAGLDVARADETVSRADRKVAEHAAIAHADIASRYIEELAERNGYQQVGMHAE